ncbi:response regulator receiver modulated metal dependent phosphohydrolase [Dissulfuribacter thermophilus]|uniref:Response regulator receiver modulated metal dependent phosphohydrolase n=1 Tax=Dissulfuribacter thermophilus TaxID=1156395 RepID=A0A1B9F5L4_9BACT|nr:HD domain-containing phosphohydrolase [Dissulfuribacter thermophilus]OCC15163.1 response regulator receiver modulated metal dependent phosphohydrolase [Dissulfuribacter thermophilus]
MNKTNKDLNSVIKISHEISYIKDLDVLLERILTEARLLTNSDAGSIYIKEGDNLKIKYTQNDTIQKRLGVNKKLIYSSFSIPINNQTISGYVAATGKTVNIKDAYSISATHPFRFNPEYDKLSNYRTVSVLSFPLKTYRNEVIGVLQLINAKDETGQIRQFSMEEEQLVLHFAMNAAVAVERSMLTREMILRMIKMAELHDPTETGAHVNRVGAYSIEIFEQWALKQGMNYQEIQRKKDILRMAAMLHDVGKIAISDRILKKPAKLTEKEYEQIKKHTYFGAKLFLDKWSEFDEAAYEISLNHHERWDGRGYPGHIDPKTEKYPHDRVDSYGRPIGKKGSEIPVFARIVAIADVYDALSSKRCYKDQWDEEKVLNVMRTEAGKQFDPEMIDAFFECLEILKSIRLQYPD